LTQPQFWVVGGPNGAGKTTLVTQRLSSRLEVINPDEIAARLPRVRGLLDERQAGQIALSQRAACQWQRKSFAIETTLTGASALRLMTSTREAGYKVTLVYVGLVSADLSSDRVADRVAQGGHDVPLDAIERRYPASLANLAKAIPLADRFFLFDNSSRQRKLLVVGKDSRVIRLTPDLPNWAIEVLG